MRKRTHVDEACLRLAKAYGVTLGFALRTRLATVYFLTDIQSCRS